jgi:RNA polymerase sigma-70 factor (ECF subfamily)
MNHRLHPADSDADREPDEALMALAAAGDRAAFGRLAARHIGRLSAIAVRVLDDRAEAEDVAQDALLRAWHHAPAYDPERAKVSTWLHRIALNCALDRRRRIRPAVADMNYIAEIPDPTPPPHTLIERSERARALAAGIAAMPARQREAIVLTYAEERAGADAAARLGISARALEGLLRRGRHFLRDWLQTSEA